MDPMIKYAHNVEAVAYVKIREMIEDEYTLPMRPWLMRSFSIEDQVAIIVYRRHNLRHLRQYIDTLLANPGYINIREYATRETERWHDEKDAARARAAEDSSDDEGEVGTSPLCSDEE
jgi:hypothetical protein